MAKRPRKHSIKTILEFDELLPSRLSSGTVWRIVAEPESHEDGWVQMTQKSDGFIYFEAPCKYSIAETAVSFYYNNASRETVRCGLRRVVDAENPSSVIWNFETEIQKKSSVSKSIGYAVFLK